MPPDSQNPLDAIMASMGKKKELISANPINAPQPGMSAAKSGALGGAASVLPAAGTVATVGGPVGWGLGAAMVLGGLVKGIFGAKSAQKDRKAAIANSAAQNAANITLKGAESKNQALESLMRSL